MELPFQAAEDGVDLKEIILGADLGHQVRVWPALHRHFEVSHPPGRIERVHPHHALLAAEVHLLEPVGDDVPRRVFVLRGHRIFEVENQRVRRQRQGPLQHLFSGAGDEMYGAP